MRKIQFQSSFKDTCDKIKNDLFIDFSQESIIEYLAKISLFNCLNEKKSTHLDLRNSSKRS